MLSVFTLVWSWLKQIYTTVLAKLGLGETQPEDPTPVDPGFDTPIGPGEVVCYYGCPNSKKAQKLQLQKKLYH